MSSKVECDGCERTITTRRGWRWATFRRKWWFRVYKFLARGKKRDRYDFCRNCWRDILNEVKEKADE